MAGEGLAQVEEVVEESGCFDPAAGARVDDVNI